MTYRYIALAAFALATTTSLFAQEPVVGVQDPEYLFTDLDSQQNANKQVVLHVMRELLQCNHWDRADEWLSERYLQHNPNIASGRAGVVRFFSTRPREEPCGVLRSPVVAVLADGDLVTIAVAREYDDPRSPGRRYTTTWFDMWRIVDGKADEHWDAATIPLP
jgi:predicted SnoaL-like aldol condensation-catalyzing enzyme